MVSIDTLQIATGDGGFFRRIAGIACPGACPVVLTDDDGGSLTGIPGGRRCHQHRGTGEASSKIIERVEAVGESICGGQGQQWRQVEAANAAVKGGGGTRGKARTAAGCGIIAALGVDDQKSAMRHVIRERAAGRGGGRGGGGQNWPVN